MKSISHLILIIFLLMSCDSMAARVDSFAILKTDIHLSVRNFGARKIIGFVTHHIRFKVNTDQVALDLSGMTVDSIKNGSEKLSFSRVKERINIVLEKVYQVNDSCHLSIFYQGTPAADPTGWGGFYFNGDFAFNLGVGFGVNPHSYGRAWFPCVDEFMMKSAYEMFIDTDTGYSAACNGILKIASKNINGTITWHYYESKPMSAYLASVSVSKYSLIQYNHAGISANFPVWLMCKPSDTGKVRASFINLSKAIMAFENAFGPQVYSKVGYNLVPFNSGAMEHAGNITFPSVYADGTLANEGLMAHELSHHWWGNNVTCTDEGDMWLNEGWASYCEHFFMEQVHGRQAYKNSILANHLYVLRYAHTPLGDGTVFSMVNIPHSNTYGNHVYKKGADVVHSLRGVLGDSVFFKACKAYQLYYKFGNANTANMQNIFEMNGGGTKATDFFTNWVFEKGFPHVIISKEVHSGNGPYNLRIFTLQRPRFTNKLYRNLPVEVFFFKDRNTYEKRVITIQEMTDSFSFTFSFKPVYVCLDYDEKLSDAITERTVVSNEVAAFDLPETFSRLILKNSADTSMVRLEHHWVGPELFRIDPPYMSNYRYHTLDGIWNDSLKMDLELTYDGRQSSAGYLDHTLIYKTEDSLTVLYRGFPGDHWRVWPDMQFTHGNSKNDKAGKVLIKNAKRGDYVFAMYDKSLGLRSGNNIELEEVWTLSPNPGGDEISLDFIHEPQDVPCFIEVLDITGKSIYNRQRQPGEKLMSINTTQWPSGTYTVKYYGRTFQHVKKLVLSR